jgi:L-cysteine/cystine lyase
VDLRAVRAELPVLERYAYLNAGTFGPLPRRTVEAVSRCLEHDLAEGRSGKSYFETVLALRERVRDVLGRLIGAPEGSIALTSSTTDGCNIAVNALRLGPDDEVVTTDLEHPGLEGGLRVSGARLRVVELRTRSPEEALAALEAAITPRTRLIALSHVAWTSGVVLPVRELAGRGIPVLVDGAQGAGAIPVDVRELGCDFYTVSAQKWLLGPDSTGCLYVRPELVEDLRVAFPSYLSWKRGTFELASGAPRFEPGWIPTGSLEGLLASLEFAEEAGSERFARGRAMAERCRGLLAERTRLVTPPGQATLVTFAPEEDAAELVARLAAAGVVIRDLPGLGWARASVGFWTSDDDLERLAAGL